MTHRHAFEAVDRSLRDVTKTVDPDLKDTPFGGKVVVFGGDFRQIPPVIKKGGREEVVRACFKNSCLWELRNAAAADIATQTEFANWLLQVGEGSAPGTPICDGSTAVNLPAGMTLPAGATTEDLIARIYPDLCANLGNGQYMTNRAILCPRNEVKMMNERIMAIVAATDPSRETREYFSADEVADKDESVEIQYPVEFLNSVEASCLPPHRLKLAIGTPVMLLRNISPKRGNVTGRVSSVPPSVTIP